MEFKQVDKDYFDKNVGILQPMAGIEDLEKLADKEFDVKRYSDALSVMLKDEDVREEVKERIREILVLRIAEPYNSIKELLNAGNWNKTTLDEELAEDFRVNDKPVGLNTVNVKKNSSGDTYVTGTKALEAARASLGIRANKEIALMASGFWIVIANIKTSDIINLEEKLTNISIEVREAMLGIEYTVDNFMYLEVILDFIKEHLVGSSLNIDLTEVTKHILMADAEMLYAGIIDAIEPRGFVNYFKCTNSIALVKSESKDEGVVTGDEKINDFETETNDNDLSADEYIDKHTGMKTLCNKTFSAKLNVKSMLRVASNRLTSEQKLLLTKPKNSVSLEDLKTYEEAFIKDEDILEVKEEELNVKLMLKPALIVDVISTGKYWFRQIEDSLSKLSMDLEDTQRVEDYAKHYRSQALGIYAPYIREYIINEDMRVSDSNTILEILAEVTENDTLASAISKGIIDFIDKRLISIYMVPKFQCANCEEEHSKDEVITEGAFKGLLPVNLRKYFFTLLTLRG